MGLKEIIAKTTIGLSMLPVVVGIGGCGNFWETWKSDVGIIRVCDRETRKGLIPAHLSKEELVAGGYVNPSEGWDMFFSDGWNDKNGNGLAEEGEFMNPGNTMRRNEKPLFVIKTPPTERNINWGGSTRLMVVHTTIKNYFVNPIMNNHYALFTHDQIQASLLSQGPWLTDHSPNNYEIALVYSRDGKTKGFYKEFTITE